MRKKIGGVMIVLLSTLSLPGCTFMRSIGPCYGYGCHGFAPIPSGPPTAAAPQARRGNAQAENRKAAPPQLKQGS
jgi:hypothetical protein